MKKYILFFVCVLSAILISGCGGEEKSISGGTEANTVKAEESDTSIGEAATYSAYIDKTDFDIDGNGVKEHFSIVSGPTSGLYSIYIRVGFDDGRQYSTAYYPSAGECKFAVSESGKLQVECTGLSVKKYCDVSVEDGKVLVAGLE